MGKIEDKDRLDLILGRGVGGGRITEQGAGCETAKPIPKRPPRSNHVVVPEYVLRSAAFAETQEA
jgi:hypothetical protein